MGYIGNQATPTFSSIEKQTITGDGSTGYTLTNSVANGNDIAVFVNNVRQEPGSGKAYTASGTTITFSEAINSSDDCYVLYLGRSVATVTPPDDSVQTATIQSSAVTTAKIADDAVTAAKIGSLPTGSVIQVVQSQSSTVFAPTSGGGSWTDTGYSVTITPSSSSNKVLFTFSGTGILLNSNHSGIRLMRNTSAVHQQEWYSDDSSRWSPFNFGFSYLDSPTSTSAVTYKVQAWSQTLTSAQEYRINYQSTANGTGEVVCLVQEIQG